MDSPTITWYRFCFALTFVFILLAKRRALPSLSQVPQHLRWVLLIATLALVVNYVANVKGLKYINPETVQVLMQLAPMLLMLGGILFFKERFSRLEMVGAATLIIGLLLFFNTNIVLMLSTMGDYTLGVLMIILAATTWSAYALLQKVLLRALTAKQLTLLIYAIGALMLFPFVQLSDITGLNSLQAWALIFCCLNTLIAYGAFTEALNVWQASKVSAVIGTAPIFTFISMHFAVQIWPQHFVSSELNGLAYVGAAMVMTGSVTAALGKSN